MRARSAIFDLFGGHLRRRGGAVTIAALVRLMEPLGFAGPAVRTAVSRTVRQGWLRPTRLPSGPGYALTPKAERRLDEAAGRIYRTRDWSWDGNWHLLVLTGVSDRHRRERIAASLGLLGYGEVEPLVWVAPRPSPELPDLLTGEDLTAHAFLAAHQGSDRDLAGRAWDLVGLSRDYAAFVARWRPLAAAVDESREPAAFAASQRLLHDWRKFLFRDPGLPPALLPADWTGHRAAEFFDGETARFAPAADRYVERCLAAPPPALPTP
ncbi:PaaX family transcriptional regulator [Actinoalloteichus caeruleus]|uniref:PaaX family transcriptional regulator n=1 Tax=Actinoalloteichus cyanogriseus TaxID=2893586 RepID=UPI003AABC5DA